MPTRLPTHKEQRSDGTQKSARGKRAALVFALLGVLLAALMVANLCVGSQPISAGELLAVLSGADRTSTAAQVVLSIRLPRLLEATLLGGALALSGLLLQTFFANPIAGPYVLGISHGAKLAVAVTMVLVVGAQGVMTSWMGVTAATLGSLAAMGLVLLASRRIGSPGMLVVAGVMIGYVCNAATDFVITFASDASIVNLRNWSMGSFSGANWTDVTAIAVVVLAASALVFMMSKPLGAYLLGERYAQSVGVNIPAFRGALILLSSVLAACVTAFAGPISFVGVAVPHIARRLMATNKPLVVIPAAWLSGAVFCLVSDFIARTTFAPTEMSVSTVTAMLGAPVVIWVLVRSKRQRTSQGLAAQAEEAPAPRAEQAAPARQEAQAEEPHKSRAVLLQTQDLAVGYDDTPLLRNVSTTAEQGRIVTLIGPNGAGKSTMLRTLAGMLDILQGSVSLCNKDLASLQPQELARIRAVLLTERLSTELLTCADVVEMGRYPHTGRLGVLGDQDYAAMREAMELVGVWDLRNKDFAQVSDGQRQRVLIARAICQEPRVLLLDEPTSYLDIRYQIELLETLRHLAQARQVAIVLSLHDLSFARQVSDWLVCIKDDGVLAQGTPNKICRPSIINELYDLRPGSFDPTTGTIVVGPHAHTKGGAASDDACSPTVNDLAHAQQKGGDHATA